MELLDKFLPYVGTNPQNSYVEQHFGIQLAKKYAALSDELGKLRLNSLAAASLDASGNIQIANRPGLTAIHGRISVLEPKVERIVEIASEVGRILESVGINDPLDREQSFGWRLEHLEMSANPAPSCWQEFARLHGMNPGKLPSDILQIDEYAAFEKARREKSDAALQEIKQIKAARDLIDSLLAEASSL